MKVSQIKLGIRSFLTSFAIAAGLIAVPVSQAYVNLNTTGGTSCKGSSGNGAQLFYFSNTSALNTSGSPQYLTCELPYGNNVNPRAPVELYVVGHNPTGASVHFSCAVQAGSEGHTINTALYQVDLPAGSFGYVVDATAGSSPAVPPEPSSDSPYSLSCLVPAGARIGLINMLLDETW